MNIGSGNTYPTAVLTHSMGSSKKEMTVLTEREFCSILTKLRDELDKNMIDCVKNERHVSSKGKTWL